MAQVKQALCLFNKILTYIFLLSTVLIFLIAYFPPLPADYVCVFYTSSIYLLFMTYHSICVWQTYKHPAPLFYFILAFSSKSIIIYWLRSLSFQFYNRRNSMKKPVCYRYYPWWVIALQHYCRKAELPT